MEPIAGWLLLIVAGSIISPRIQEVFPSTAAAQAARSASVSATTSGDEEISELRTRGCCCDRRAREWVAMRAELLGEDARGSA
jgi:hypothetical protein